MDNLKEALDGMLYALERLLYLFRIERMLHLVIGIIGFLLLIYATIGLLTGNELTTAGKVSLFGSSGLITVSSARITYFFNKAFGLVEKIINSNLKSESSSEQN